MPLYVKLSHSSRCDVAVRRLNRLYYRRNLYILINLCYIPLRSRGQSVKTSPFHGGVPGSTPGAITNVILTPHIWAQKGGLMKRVIRKGCADLNGLVVNSRVAIKRAEMSHTAKNRDDDYEPNPAAIVSAQNSKKKALSSRSAMIKRHIENCDNCKEDGRGTRSIVALLDR